MQGCKDNQSRLRDRQKPDYIQTFHGQSIAQIYGITDDNRAHLSDVSLAAENPHEPETVAIMRFQTPGRYWVVTPEQARTFALMLLSPPRGPVGHRPSQQTLIPKAEAVKVGVRITEDDQANLVTLHECTVGEKATIIFVFDKPGKFWVMPLDSARRLADLLLAQTAAGHRQ